MSVFNMSSLEQLKDFCEKHWLKQVVVDEAKSVLKISFKHKTYLIPFSINFLEIVKEVRFLGIIYPIKQSAYIGLIFPQKTPDDLTIVLTIGEVVALGAGQKNYENGKDLVFVTTNSTECVLKRKRV